MKRDTANHGADVARPLIARSTSLSREDVAAIAHRFPATVRGGSVCLTDGGDPSLAHEVLQYAFFLTVAAPGWQTDESRAVEVGVAQYLTEHMLRRSGTAFVDQVEIVKGLVGHVGHEAVVDAFLHGTPDGLRALANQASAGAGDAHFMALADASLHMLADQRLVAVATSAKRASST